MSKHTNGAKDSEKKTLIDWKIAYSSNVRFVNAVLAAIARGYLKVGKKGQISKAAFELAKAQKDAAQYTHKRINFMATNGAMTTSKTVAMIAPDIPLSPIYSMQKSSKRARHNIFVSQVVMELCRELGVKNLHVYMVTLTVPNCDMGQYANVYSDLSGAITRLNKNMDNSVRRGGGVQLASVGGGFAKYLGDHVAFETTTNVEKLKAHNSHGILHPHIHMILLTDGELDLKSRVTVTNKDVPNMVGTSYSMTKPAAEIYKYWAKSLPQYDLSPDALSVEEAYSQKDEKNKEAVSADDQIMDALVEANKYAIKPDLWKTLPVKTGDFEARLVAEMIKTLRRKNLHRNHGVFYDAFMFLNFAAKNGMGSAVMNASFKHFVPTYNVPDMFTNIREHVVTDTKAKWLKSHKMNDDQLLWFNKNILGGAGFDGSLFDKVTFPDTKKGAMFKRLFSELDFVERGRDGLLDRFDIWITKLENSIADAKDSGTDNASYVEYLNKKLADTTAIAKAAEDLDSNGRYEFKVNWNTRSKILQVMNMMKEMEESTGIDWIDLTDDNSHRPVAKVEKTLLDCFGREFLCYGDKNGKYLPWNWAVAYNSFKKLNDLDSWDVIWNWTEKTFNKRTNDSLALYDKNLVDPLNRDSNGRVKYLSNLSKNSCTMYRCSILKAEKSEQNRKYTALTHTNYTDCKVTTADQLQRIISKIK